MSKMRASVATSLLLLVGCATTTPAEDRAAARVPGISPADLVASIADIAAGRNAAMREAGIYLKSIEFKLLVGTEEQVGGKAKVVVLDVESSRKSEVSFLQTFILEVPAAPSKGIAVTPLPEVRAFVETAMETARDLAAAAASQGLPHRIESVELVAKLTVSRKAGGGIAFTIPALASASLNAGATRAVDEANTVRLKFLRAY